jgi:hypothetical protein
MPVFKTSQTAAYEALPERVPPKTNNPVPIEERTFQSAAAHQPISWALPALKIAALGAGSMPLF